MATGASAPPSLRAAVEADDLAAVESALTAGANVNEADPHGRIPLCIAAYRQHSVIVDRLLAAGADVNHRDRDGSVPLHYAAQVGNHHAVAAMLALGADPNVVTEQGAPADVAHFGGHYVTSRSLADRMDPSPPRDFLGQRSVRKQFADDSAASWLSTRSALVAGPRQRLRSTETVAWDEQQSGFQTSFAALERQGPDEAIGYRDLLAEESAALARFAHWASIDSAVARPTDAALNTGWLVGYEINGRADTLVTRRRMHFLMYGARDLASTFNDDLLPDADRLLFLDQLNSVLQHAGATANEAGTGSDGPRQFAVIAGQAYRVGFALAAIIRTDADTLDPQTVQQIETIRSARRVAVANL